MPDVIQIAKGAEAITIVGILVIIILAGYKRVWVWGWQFDEIKKERDFLQERLGKLTYMTERSVQVAETAVEKVMKP